MWTFLFQLCKRRIPKVTAASIFQARGKSKNFHLKMKSNEILASRPGGLRSMIYQNIVLNSIILHLYFKYSQICLYVEASKN